MTTQNDDYDCCYCTLVNLLKFIGRHCKHFHNITHESDTRIMWTDNEDNYHFESYEKIKKDYR